MWGQFIISQYCPQTALIKCAVMSYKRQVFYLRQQLCPYLREKACIFGITLRKPMYLGTERGIIVRTRLYQFIKSFSNFRIFNKDKSYTAYTTAVLAVSKSIATKEVMVYCVNQASTTKEVFFEYKGKNNQSISKLAILDS